MNEQEDDRCKTYSAPRLHPVQADQNLHPAYQYAPLLNKGVFDEQTRLCTYLNNRAHMTLVRHEEEKAVVFCYPLIAAIWFVQMKSVDVHMRNMKDRFK